MIEVKINGQTYNMPTDVTELTLKQFFDVRNAKDVIDEICALTGLERDAVSNFKSTKDLQNGLAVVRAVSETMKRGFDVNKLPKSIKVAGKTIEIPKKLRLEPVGAFISVHDVITEQHNFDLKLKREFNPTDTLPQVLAHYLFVHVDGGLYSDEKVESEEYMSHIWNMRFIDAVPIGNFFFFAGFRTYRRTQRATKTKTACRNN